MNNIKLQASETDRGSISHPSSSSSTSADPDDIAQRSTSADPDDIAQSSTSADRDVVTLSIKSRASVIQMTNLQNELELRHLQTEQEKCVTPADGLSMPAEAPITTLPSPLPTTAGNQSTSTPASTSPLPPTQSSSSSSHTTTSKQSPSPDEDKAKKKSDIGPYAAAVDLSSDHLKQPVESLPVIGTIKNGLVTELYNYLVLKNKYSLNHVAKVIIKISDKIVEPSKVKNVSTYVSQVYLKERELSRYKKVSVDQSVTKLNDFKDAEFQVLRGKKRGKTEDTPRKKRLRQEVKTERQQRKKVTKRLQLSEEKVSQLEVKLSVSQGLHEKVEDEVSKRRKAEQHAKEADDLAKKAQETQRKAEINAEKAERTIIELEKELNIKTLNLEAIQAKFNPLHDDVEKYKEQCDIQMTQIKTLEAKCKEASTKIASLGTRNVNKRIKRRDERIKSLEEDTTIVDSLKGDLEDTKAKLQQTSSVCQTLKSKLEDTKKQRTSLVKKVWYRDKRITELSSSCYSEEDIEFYQNRAEVLEVRVRELEECISLCEDRSVTTFEDGQYTNTVRELIMELLSLNVSMSAVNKVIRSTLRKMANIEVGRLPSIGTTSKIVTEARVLADIEIGLAMKEARPEDVLGNVVHGDGTTKYHKKYQNFQVTLPDNSSRTTGLTQMGLADTGAVVNSYKTRMREIAAALETVSETNEDSEVLYKELMMSVKSTMTDQGPTMPQFSEKLKSIREEILPTVISNWDGIPDDVKSTMKNFGTFYCKMHPLINCAEEVNKVLKSYEDIATKGKNAHTIVTSEAGVTRLIRTASKAFHHRGSDKSGVEDDFTEFIQQKYGESKNRLVNYIGNRANILFEGAATTLYHIKHMTSFVHAQPTPNLLLLAVCEDAEELIHLAELKALAMVHKVITEPLWAAVRSCSSILDLNSTLFSLQQKLNIWKDDPEGLMNGDGVIPNIDINKDELYDCAFSEEDNSEVHGMCVQALQLICCSILLIIERQCQDNLPGGKYWDTTDVVKQQFANVPATNLIGERDFAILDMLVRQKPNARTINLEALVMWMNNGTVKWLERLDDETKNKYFDAARKHADTAVAHYNEKMVQIKKERWEKLQEKQKSKEEKEKKALEDRVKLTEDVVAQGGVWGKEMVNRKFVELKTRVSNERVRREIFKQLLFHQKILKSKAPQKDFFQLTTTVDGKKHTFTKEEMKDHLQAIVELNGITSTRDITVSEPEPAPAVVYTNTLDLGDKFERKKLEIAKKLEDERQKRAVVNSKKHLQQLVESPQLLVGKLVKHKCVSPDGVAMWYPGIIESVVGEPNGEKTCFVIRYNEEYLAEDEPVKEEFPLLMDLKKKDLIIVDRL